MSNAKKVFWVIFSISLLLTVTFIVDLTVDKIKIVEEIRVAEERKIVEEIRKDAPNKLMLADFLRQGKFDELEDILVGYQEKYEFGEALESDVDLAFFAFDSSDPFFEPRLNQWINKNPGSYAARMARGIYYWRLGWLSRGYSVVGLTPDERFKKMRDFFALSAVDLTAAIRLNKRLSLAYGLLINIKMTQGRYEEMDEILRAGLDANPDSAIIRERYIFALQPWWNGRSDNQSDALRDISEFVDEIAQETAEFPQLKALQGYNDYVNAEILSDREKYRKANQYYDRAIQYGDYWWYYQSRGVNNYYRGHYEDAIIDFDRALVVRPQTADALAMRAKSYQELDRYDEAFADWDLALRLSPLDPEILLAKAYALHDKKRYREAVSELDKALVYGAYDEYVRDARGRLYLYELSDPALGLGDLKMTTELDPNSPRYWYNYSRALYETEDCKAVTAFSSYLKVCRARGDCSAKNTKFANNGIEQMTKVHHCPH